MPYHAVLTCTDRETKGGEGEREEERERKVGRERERERGREGGRQRLREEGLSNPSPPALHIKDSDLVSFREKGKEREGGRGLSNLLSFIKAEHKRSYFKM